MKAEEIRRRREEIEPIINDSDICEHCKFLYDLLERTNTKIGVFT